MAKQHAGRRSPQMVKRHVTFRREQLEAVTRVAEAEHEGNFARAVRALVDKALRDQPADAAA